MWRKTWQTIFCCLLLVVFCQATIADEIAPFAVAFLIALVVAPIWHFAPPVVLIITELWRYPVPLHLVSVLLAVTIYLVTVLSWRLWKNWRRWQWLILVLTYVMTHCLEIYFAVADPFRLVKALLSIFGGIIFLLAVLVCFRAVQQKKFVFPWTVDQLVCLLGVVVIFSLGLCGWRNPYFSLQQFVTIFAIFWGVYYADGKATVMLATALGLGAGFAESSLVPVAVDVLLCLACWAFRHQYRVYSIVAVVLTDLVIGFYFGAYGGYSWWRLLPIGVAVLLFLVLPRSVARYFTFGNGGLGGFLVSKNTINRNTAGISLRLKSLATVFNEMQNTYRNLTNVALPPHETAKLMASDLATTVCANCPQRNVCRKTLNATKDLEEGLVALCQASLNSGVATLLEVPNTVAIKCTHLNLLLSSLNKTLSIQQNKAQIIAGLDSGKILMANLLSGVSQLCSKFAGDVCRTVVFDNERGEQVKEELLYRNIYAEDCLITKTSKNEYVVSVLVPRGDAHNQKLERVVSRVCGHKMIVDEVVDADTKGYAIVSVRSAPKYHLLFGMAGVTKGANTVSGDNFSFLRITNEKTLMALCDGMGAGERASRASTLALCLVENFYKAGFPDEIIMYSVNQLLTFTGQDVFSALDLCVFDLATGETDFIKVGATDGYLKREQEVEIVEAGSLPLGILDDIEPKITKAILQPGDQVILVSDGVLDAFNGDRVLLAGFINNLEATTPQELAEKLLSAVVGRSEKNPADDCTVTVAKLVKM